MTLTSLLVCRDLDRTTVKGIRRELAGKLGLAQDSLDHKKGEIEELCRQIIAVVCARKSAPHAQPEDPGNERPSASKMIYLVSISHPSSTHSEDGVPLRKPAEFSREEIRDIFLQVCDSLQGTKIQRFQFVYISVFLETHEGGEPHYHLPVKGCRAFRFLPFKKALLAQHGLASHWATTHDYYASAFRYCYMPSKDGKAIDELDPTPLLWPEGIHPPPREARRAPTTAKALETGREDIARKRAAENKTEQRFRDIDLWPIVVNETIKPNRDCAEKIVAYAKRCGGPQMTQWCFDNEVKLTEIVARCWRFEFAEECVVRMGKSRMQILQEAKDSACVCEGKWLPAARELFFRNSLDIKRWQAAVHYAFEHGRKTKGTLVCHAGLEGNEGLPLSTSTGSFLLARGGLCSGRSGRLVWSLTEGRDPRIRAMCSQAACEARASCLTLWHASSAKMRCSHPPRARSL